MADHEDNFKKDGQVAGAGLKLPPLTEDQIEYAHELLAELHPLEKTHICEAFPWLGAATCHKKKEDAAVNDEFVADNEGLLMDTKKPKTVMIGGKEVVKKAPK